MADVIKPNENLPARSERSNAEFLMNRKKLKVVADVRGDLTELRAALNEQQDPKLKERRKKRYSPEKLEKEEEAINAKIEELLVATGESFEVLYKDREATDSLTGLVDKLNISQAMEDEKITSAELIGILKNQSQTTDQLGLLAAEVDDEIQTIDDYKESLGVGTFDSIKDRVNGAVDMVIAKNPALGEKLEKWGFDAEAIMNMIMNAILSFFERLSWLMPPKLKKEMAMQRLELEADSLEGTYEQTFYADVESTEKYSNKFISEYLKWLNGQKQADKVAANSETVAPGRPTLIDIIDGETASQTAAVIDKKQAELNAVFGKDGETPRNERLVDKELEPIILTDRNVTLNTSEMTVEKGGNQKFDFVNNNDELVTLTKITRVDKYTAAADVVLVLGGDTPTLQKAMEAVDKLLADTSLESEAVPGFGNLKVRRKQA